MEHSEDTPYPLVDSHAHLTWVSFGDIEPVVERARRAGVTRVLTVATDPATSEQGIGLAQRFPEVYAAVGVHPNDLDGEVDLARLRRLSAAPKVVAIGETGLDYYRRQTAPEAQRRAFAAQLDLAAELRMPIVVHNREADTDVLAALRSYPGVRGVLHCFSGEMALAEAGLALGFYISLAGNVTYAKAANLRETAASVPLDRLLVETDAPFLSPVPHRGRRNEPAYVRHTLDELARCREQPPEALGAAVVANARALFAW